MSKIPFISYCRSISPRLRSELPEIQRLSVPVTHDDLKANQSCGFKLRRILTPAQRERSTKMLKRNRETEEPVGTLDRITRGEGESDESESDLYFGRNSFGYRHCGLPGPRR